MWSLRLTNVVNIVDLCGQHSLSIWLMWLTDVDKMVDQCGQCS